MSTLSTSIAGVILAAGMSRRLGSPKAEYIYEGERLIDRAVRLFQEVGISEIYVITGSWNGEVQNAQKIFNPNFEEGISSSLQVAFTKIDVEKVCITLVDLIGISATAIERLVNCEQDLAIAQFDDHSQPPLLVHQRFFEEFREQLRGDVGLRQILKDHQDVAKIYVGDIATDQDLDTLG